MILASKAISVKMDFITYFSSLCDVCVVFTRNANARAFSSPQFLVDFGVTNK